MSTLGGSPNILLIVADDLGKDLVSVGGSGSSRSMSVKTNDGSGAITGTLPSISLLLRNGVLFEHAWAQPACSPTRASIFTGLHPWKTGIGSPAGNRPLDPDSSWATLPELLPNTYRSGLFGKWHLGGDATTSPIEHGWDKHFGTFMGFVDDYYDWTPVDSDGDYDEASALPSAEYVTAVTVREAANWINAQDPDAPWFVTMAFHTPHSPFQEPPPSTTGLTGASAAVDPTSAEYLFNLMTQNMDHNIGGLIGTPTSGPIPRADFDFDPISRDQMDNTIIVFIGDNGSDPFVAAEEPKTYVYEGSLRVPMIIADGASVMAEFNDEPSSPRFLNVQRPGSTSYPMVHVTDLFTTILRLADPDATTSPANSDSADLVPFLETPIVSLKPSDIPIGPTFPPGGVITGPGGNDVFLPEFTNVSVRETNFSQWYGQTAERATIRNERYKLNYVPHPIDDTEPDYSLYRYEDGEIPGIEGVNDIPEATTNLYDDAINRIDNEARENLDALLDELLSNHKRNETEDFDDPRPFPVP